MQQKQALTIKTASVIFATQINRRMSIVSNIKEAASRALQSLYNIAISDTEVLVNSTKPEFEGDYTIVLFAFIKQLKKSPELLGKEIGDYLLTAAPQLFSKFNVIKGFLNLTINDAYWLSFLSSQYNNDTFGIQPQNGIKVMVEYSSPNTNKPLHLGHLRNNFLGWSTAELLKACGNDVVKTCVVNDRGIHICKSMIAWQWFGNSATPENTGLKGDHLVGDYYVRFNEEYKKETNDILKAINNDDFSLFSESEGKQIIISQSKIEQLNELIKETINKTNFTLISHLSSAIETSIESAIEGDIKWKNIHKIYDSSESDSLSNNEKEANQKLIQKVLKPIITIDEKIEAEKEIIEDLAGSKTKIQKAAQNMLIDWEAGKTEVIHLWQQMNSWVYKGFDETYRRIGTDFNKIYYESSTYLLGKNLVAEGLEKGVFYKKPDGSVWIDLTADGLDEKVLQRKDGTSVYITQDIGLAEQKQAEFNIQQSIYVVGDEQNYHFKVLKLICQKLGLPSADGIHHLSYGMVELPTGKMKSREGTVVDADDLLDEMIRIAQQKTEELGKIKDFTKDELTALYNTIGIGALKFFILRVDPKKRMVFNPEESIDFHGFTAPFIQYTYARIKSILRKENNNTIEEDQGNALLPLEKELIIHAEQFTTIIREAATEYDPSKLAIYIFNLAKIFNSFYTEHSVSNAESISKKNLRLQLCILTANIIKTGMRLLGIEVPEKM